MCSDTIGHNLVGEIEIQLLTQVLCRGKFVGTTELQCFCRNVLVKLSKGESGYKKTFYISNEWTGWEIETLR